MKIAIVGERGKGKLPVSRHVTLCPAREALGMPPAPRALLLCVGRVAFEPRAVTRSAASLLITPVIVVA